MTKDEQIKWLENKNRELTDELDRVYECMEDARDAIEMGLGGAIAY